MLNEALAPGVLPPGQRIYAIGDVHGCASQLAALHSLISADAARRPVPQVTLVHLGDYVDRGPDSAAVLDRLLASPPVPGAAVVNLVGNHETMLLDACDPDAHLGALPFWLENGGAATLASYDADPTSHGWWDLIPEAHLDLLRQCRLAWAAGDYLFVHAGIRPDMPLDAQDPFDLLWIREPFLSWDGGLPAVVVHGHTPSPVPTVLEHRIGIDTGACYGGQLTCLVLEGERMGFLAV
jgi:serine/threonine protein phosphatase 1